VRYGHLYKFIVNIYLADKCAEGERRRQISERRRQKEANKDLQDDINSFIIH
jgi:hypothetical protein